MQGGCPGKNAQEGVGNLVDGVTLPPLLVFEISGFGEH